MLVITGAQRSGTSVMALFFKQCGFEIEGYWDHRVDGGFEDPHICNFYRDLVGCNFFPYWGFWEKCDLKTFKSFANLNSRVVKFSYLTMIPQFAKQWLASRGPGKDSFIVMMRDPGKIVRSKNSKPEFQNEDWPPLSQTSEELRKNINTSLNILSCYHANCSIIKFPITRSPVSTLERYITLPEDAEQIWSTIYDTTQIHF
jgi:hypothetical protein